MEQEQGIHVLSGTAVGEALERSARVYLAGHLERPQEVLEHVGGLAEPTELGITRYDELTVDTPHLHERNTDFTYVVRGTFMVRMLETGEVWELGENSLCVIDPGVAHVCIALPGTQVLFVKVPGGNDKVPVELDDASRTWVSDTVSAASVPS